MKSYSEEEGTNILINLSNLFLCQAVQKFLEGEPTPYRAVAAIGSSAVPEGYIPDKILVDANTLVLNPLARWPDAKLILIDTGLHKEELITLLLNHKLYGIISTETDLQLFRKALNAIHNGQVWIDNSKLKALIHGQNQQIKAPAHETLSKKERDVVLLVAAGRKNREIAEKLSISEQTVKAHLNRIFRKVNVTCRSQLVPLALTFASPLSQ
ncbi:MAG: hypothetical protein GJV46_09810 [Geobacter sp.]|nr:hypothetical protein [Geobacter sp.]